jgi:hypothetical protein
LTRAVIGLSAAWCVRTSRGEVCELRRKHPRWGPVRLVFELGRGGVKPVPSWMSAYRALVRHGLIEPGAKRRRRRDDYRRWERPEPMALWQIDIVDGVLFLDAGTRRAWRGQDRDRHR